MVISTRCGQTDGQMTKIGRGSGLRNLTKSNLIFDFDLNRMQGSLQMQCIMSTISCKFDRVFYRNFEIIDNGVQPINASFLNAS